MFIYRAIKSYKELWGAEDSARSEGLKSVRAEAAIKTARERTGRNPLRKQKIISIIIRKLCNGLEYPSYCITRYPRRWPMR